MIAKETAIRASVEGAVVSTAESSSSPMPSTLFQVDTPASSSPIPSTTGESDSAEETEATTTSSWAGNLWNMFSSFYSHLGRSNGGSDDAATVLERRDCSLLDTTPNNDLEEFRAAVSIMTGSNQTPPWTKTTSYTEIPICRQSETWDCGVACLQMVLAWLRDDTTVTSVSYKEEREWMLNKLDTQSIWTIDLFVLLSNMCDDKQCSLLLCSKTLGVDREHNSLHYYEKAFGKDQMRVDELFAKAHDLDLNMVCLSHLGLAQVIRLVAQPHIVAIILLDNSVLLRRTRQTYAGHYVILCGLSCDPVHVHKSRKNDQKSTDEYCMVVKNPGSGNEVDYVSPFLLERAWRATGTDDDILFVTKRR